MQGFRPPNHTAKPETRAGEATTYRPQALFRANRIHHGILAKDMWISGECEGSPASSDNSGPLCPICATVAEDAENRREGELSILCERRVQHRVQHGPSFTTESELVRPPAMQGTEVRLSS